MTRAVRFDKNDLAQTAVAIKYAQHGLWDEAATSLKSATATAPGLASTHYNLGVAYDALGRYDAAASSIERVVQLEPKDKYIQALAQVRRNARDAAILRAQGANP